jgi:hypothetical protein
MFPARVLVVSYLLLTRARCYAFHAPCIRSISRHAPTIGSTVSSTLLPDAAMAVRCTPTPAAAARALIWFPSLSLLRERGHVKNGIDLCRPRRTCRYYYYVHVLHASSRWLKTGVAASSAGSHGSNVRVDRSSLGTSLEIVAEQQCSQSAPTIVQHFGMTTTPSVWKYKMF